jgi:hypothetical protein
MQSLCFRGAKDLAAKSKDIDTSTNALWRKMLVSQHSVRDVDVNFHIEVQCSPRNWKSVAIVFRECIREDRDDNDELKMEDGRSHRWDAG